MKDLKGKDIFDVARDFIIPSEPEVLRERLFIDGIEVTQAIQYYHSDKHMTDSVDHRPDNSIPMMAGKAAWVRVYVRGIMLNTPVVTGELEVQHVGTVVSSRILPSISVVPGKVSLLSPQPPGNAFLLGPGRIIDPDYPVPYFIEREDLRYTLNWVLAAEEMIGILKLRVTIRSGYLSSSQTFYINATRLQTLRLAGIMIAYNGPDRTGMPIILNAPTLADLQATSALSLTVMPVQAQATYRTAGTITWNQPLTDPQNPGGGCSNNWILLLNEVQQAIMNDGNRDDVIYYGLMANGIPVGPVIGCNRGTESAGNNGDRGAMLHEIGHRLGLPHAPCGLDTSDTNDPSYPLYEPYPSASIGEYGLDNNIGSIHNPIQTKDYMSYCGPSWISLYNYMNLIGKELLDFQYIPVIGPWDLIEPRPANDARRISEGERQLSPPSIPPTDEFFRSRAEPEPLISIIGIVHDKKTIEVQSVSRVLALRYIPNATRTEFIAELLDEDGKVLSKGSLFSLASYACAPCKSKVKISDYPYSFQAILTDVKLGAKIRILREEQEIWTRQAPSSPPRVSGLTAKVKRDSLEINWTFKSYSEHEPVGWLQYSKDKGKTWIGLAVGLYGNSTKIDSTTLPSTSILIRILIHDGFYTATSKPIKVDIPRRSPSIVIMNPVDGSTIKADSTLHLWGAVIRSNLERAEPKVVRWIIDDKEIATGLDVFVVSPAEGEHSCKLYVEDEGKVIEKSVSFKSISLSNRHARR